MKTTHTLNMSLLAILFLGSAWAWPHLPQSIPAHFDAAGSTTRWSPTTPLSWFALPLVALGLTALNYLVAHLLPRWPAAINFPNKQQFLSLPAERQAPVIERMREMLHGLSAPLIGLMGLIQMMTYRAARGEPSEGYIVLALLAAVLMTPLILGIWLPRVQAELDRQVRSE